MKDAIIQTFLSHFGVSDHLIGIYSTILNIINVSVLLLSPVVNSRAKNAASAIARLMVPIGICFFGFLPVCFFSDVLPVWAVFAISLVIGVTQFFLAALRDVFSYKLPYQIIDIRDYSLLVSVSGIIYGTVGIAASAVFARLVKLYRYEYVIAGAFVSAAVFMILGAILVSRYKIIDPSVNSSLPSGGNEMKREKSASFKELLLMPEFRSMIVPNFVRGIFTGVLSMTAVVALSVGFTETDVAEMVTVQQIASIFGSVIFGLLAEKFNSRYLCFIGAAFTLLMPLLSIHNKALFLVTYSVVFLAKMIVDYAVPTIISRVISYEVAGSYHSWRLLIMNMGTALSTYLVGLLIKSVPVWTILAAAALAELACGIGYCFAKPIRKTYIERFKEERAAKSGIPSENE